MKHSRRIRIPKEGGWATSGGLGPTPHRDGKGPWWKLGGRRGEARFGRNVLRYNGKAGGRGLWRRWRLIGAFGGWCWEEGKGKKAKERKKGEEEEGEEGSVRHYTYHVADRDWEDVGKRCKLVVDSQVTANLLNRQSKCRSGKYEPVVRRCQNMQYQTVKAGWKPFQNFDNFLEWRRRKYNKIADHIANESMKHRKSFSYRNYELLHAIRPGNANILVFSDGGSWETEAIASSGWVAFVLGVTGGMARMRLIF